MSIPTLIPNLNNVTDICTGEMQSFFILGKFRREKSQIEVFEFYKKGNGSILACGQNGFGELGLGDRVQRDSPTLIPNLYDIKLYSIYRSSYAILTNGSVLGWGDNLYGKLGFANNSSYILSPTLIPGLENIVEMWLGLEHAFAIQGFL